MIITDVDQGWESKVNFTDSNDVFVGFDTAQNCCEDAGYFLSYSLAPYSYDGNDNEVSKDDLDGYNFDVDFFESVESADLDGGRQVAFRLTKDGQKELYLHLYNSHNGYYGHGFNATIGGKAWQNDYI